MSQSCVRPSWSPRSCLEAEFTGRHGSSSPKHRGMAAAAVPIAGSVGGSSRPGVWRCWSRDADVRELGEQARRRRARVRS